MSKYYFEAVNPKAPAPRGSASVANRVPIDSISERKDGKYDIHMKFQGRPKTIPVDPKAHLGQNQRNMVFRNQYGIQVPPSEVIKVLKPETPKE